MKCTPCLFSARMWSERSFGSETRFTAKKLDPKSGHFDKISTKEHSYIMATQQCGSSSSIISVLYRFMEA